MSLWLTCSDSGHPNVIDPPTDTVVSLIDNVEESKESSAGTSKPSVEQFPNFSVVVVVDCVVVVVVVVGFSFLKNSNGTSSPW